MALTLEQQALIRKSWELVKKTDAANRFYDTVFQSSEEAAGVFQTMQVRRIFDEFDTNGDGRIQLNELQEGIAKSSNEEMNKEELLNLVRGVSGQSELDIEQFGQLIIQNPGVIKAYDVRKQGAKIFSMFDTVVSLMSDVNLLVPVLKSVGARHNDYGVTATYFPELGRALVQVLEDALGNSFDDATRQAWVVLYDVASSSMISGLGGGTLTTRQKGLVRDSWAKVKGTNASDKFYGRLFTVSPSAAELFKAAQIKRIFDDFDTNKDGVMQWGELKDGLARSYHVELNREAILDLIRKTTRGTSENLTVSDFQALAEANPDLVKDYNTKVQGERIFDMISVVVALVDDDRALKPVLETVGGRHAHYGVDASQFPRVGETLLYTMEKALGAEWNAELEDAWSTLYRIASSNMVDSMQAARSKL